MVLKNVMVLQKMRLLVLFGIFEYIYLDLYNAALSVLLCVNKDIIIKYNNSHLYLQGRESENKMARTWTRG